MKRFVAIVCSTLLALHAAAFERFVTRDRDRLMDGTNEFRFVGANMPGLVLPYDWTLFLPERMTLPTAWEQEDAFKTLDRMNLRVVRLWNLPIRGPSEPTQSWHYVLGPGRFNEEAFQVLDRLLALANRYNVRVIPDFTADAGDYLGGIATYAAHRGTNRAAFYTDAQVRADYQATVRFVISRTNTVTGVPYRDDRAVLAWQFGNEMHTAPDAWLSEMAAFIKSIDTNHLVAEARHRPGQPLVIDPNIDLYTRHLYGNYSGTDGGWPATIRRERERLKGERPLFVGEFGPYVDGKSFTPENVVAKTRGFLDAMRREPGVSGSLLWSMYFHHERGGFYWHQIMTYPAVWSYHAPGFPSAHAQREGELMTALREAAFAIEGRTAPLLPVPDAPELLPFADAPVFSWRGSALASGYDVERAATQAGPWTLIATNVSDADVAYRPLFNDEAARVGDRVCYRVSARNASGISAPSPAFGPVTLTRTALIDELQDFSRTDGHAPGLALDNDYNALYAEHLFRAQGSTNDWIQYRSGPPASALRIVAFLEPGGRDLRLLVSSEGRTFDVLQPERAERKLPSPPGGASGGKRRVLVEYRAALPGAHLLRIEWPGRAWLDRVELWSDAAR